MEIFVLESTYTTKDKKPVIEVYGIGRDGNRYKVSYKGFEPYCYVGCQPNKDILKRRILNHWSKEVVKVEDIDLQYNDDIVECFKVTFIQPRAVAEFRKWIPKSNAIFAADIPFGLRFFYDLDLGVCIEVDGTIQPDGTIEADIMALSEENFDVDMRILSFDIEASPTKQNIYCICSVVSDIHGNRIASSTFAIGELDEQKIIRSFIKWVNEQDPDIITGYNLVGYDIPQIIKRGKFNKLYKLIVGRDGKTGFIERTGGKRDKYWIRGRVVADAWYWAKKMRKPQRETLKFVAQMLLGRTKLDIDPTKIDVEWPTRKDEIIKYCMVDAELALDILIKLKAVDRNIALAKVSKLPLRNVFDDESTKLVDSSLIRMADAEGWAVPCGRYYNEEAEDKIIGAAVLETKPGLHKWVVAVDFGSLYPSIIRENNLCFTTYSPKNGEIITPIGARFVSKKTRVGIIPRVMEDLQGRRSEYKKLRDNARDVDEDMYIYWDMLQESVKVLMNSFYGILASSFYRFTNRAIGESITTYGRKKIKRINFSLIGRGLKVIASDTDSAFVKSPVQTKEGAIIFGNEVAKEFSTDDLVLEFEKVLSSFFSHGAKKRYISRIAWPEKDAGTLYIRGYEMRRTDSFDVATDALGKVFDLVLDDKPDDACRLARSVVKDLLEGRTALDRIVISKGCKEFTAYKKPGTLAQVQAVKKNQETGRPFIPGMKVSWIVVNSKVTPQVVEPWNGHESWRATPDWAYYAKRTARMLSRATAWYGWSEKDLLTSTRNVGLDVFPSE